MTLEATGSDPHQACLTWLCCAYRLFQPLDALFLPKPVRPCFVPVTPMGFPLQRFSPPRGRHDLSACRPLMTSADRRLKRHDLIDPALARSFRRQNFRSRYRANCWLFRAILASARRLWFVSHVVTRYALELHHDGTVESRIAYRSTIAGLPNTQRPSSTFAQVHFVPPLCPP